MKLSYRIITHLSIALSLVLTLWAGLFYFTIIEEINDEMDDSLESYSEQILVRFLAGEEVASKSNHSNNEYYLAMVTAEYAQKKPNVSYTDSMVYIPAKRETEPARILTTIFKDDDNNFYELSVLTPTIEKKDLKEAILYWVILLYITLLLLIILTSIYIYHRSNRPLYTLLAWMETYKVGGTNRPLENETDITEFRQLNEAAIRNMERAEEVFERQKQFIGNASHEMQTPLAVCRNRLENLMEDDTLTEIQLKELAKTHHTLAYMTKLNKSLLLLYKIDNDQFNNVSDIDVNSLVKQIMHDYEEVYAYMHITTNVKQTGIFHLQMNETLATILLNNLIKNSYVHNVSKGTIAIEIDSDSVRFKNTGPGCLLNTNLIFERFYQASKKESSIGLGLALVKSICDKEKLLLHYAYEENMHCFKIQRLKK